MNYPDYELIITVIPESYSSVCQELIQEGVDAKRINPPPFYNHPRFLSYIQTKLNDSVITKIEIHSNHTELTIDVLKNGRFFKMEMNEKYFNVANTCFMQKQYEGDEVKMLCDTRII
jgi:predicted transcriptional regulator